MVSRPPMAATRMAIRDRPAPSSERPSVMTLAFNRYLLRSELAFPALAAAIAGNSLVSSLRRSSSSQIS